MPSGDFIHVLFFGDLVGKPGRKAVERYLQNLLPQEKPDVIIANGENATHGFGLIERHYRELTEMGIHVITGGNHTWDRKEIVDYIDTVDNLLRPDNVPATLPGTGCRVFDFGSFKIGVINLIGQVFMGNYNSPWERLEMLVNQVKKETPVIFLDFHAEATAEKIALAHHCTSLGVSAMVGTHTHVQTADERVLLNAMGQNQMGFITDAGFNGAYNSVIGMDIDSSMLRLKSMLPARLEVALTHTLQVNAVQFKINPETGQCSTVQRISKRLEPLLCNPLDNPDKAE